MYVSPLSLSPNGVITNFGEPVEKDIQSITHARAIGQANYAKANKFLADKYNAEFGIDVPMPM